MRRRHDGRALAVDLTDHPADWPGWVLAFAPARLPVDADALHAEADAFHTWRLDRAAWVREHTTLGVPVFALRAHAEHRRRMRADGHKIPHPTEHR